MNNPLFLNSIFQQAVADIEALGLKVTNSAIPKAIPYAVIGGRSNARWWLVPLEDGRVTASGLALFQPLLNNARLIKAMAVGLSRFGLSRLWARNIIYISGESVLHQFFTHAAPLSFAYFTGTDNPHRKLAVQVMDSAGNIKGYAKVSSNPAVKALLQHEARTLNYVKILNLQTANIPNILFSGTLDNVHVLVTDTLKTPQTKSMTKLQKIHLDFLQELADKTKPYAQINPDWLAHGLRNRFEKLENQLTPEWKTRLNKAITVVEQEKEHFGLPVLAHGDFTPWNTFVAEGELYVFDWEYSHISQLKGLDYIHYFMNQPHIKNKSAALKINLLSDFSQKNAIDFKENLSNLELLTYLISQTLHQIERLDGNAEIISSWDNQLTNAEIFDVLLNHNLSFSILKLDPSSK